MSHRWPQPTPTRCSRCGAAWATTAARATCISLRARSGRAPRRSLPGRAAAARRPARNRSFDRGGDRGVRVRPARRDPRRQCPARAVPTCRRARVSGRARGRERTVAHRRGRASGYRCRGVHAGSDGPGRDSVRANPPGVRRVPARCRLPGLPRRYGRDAADAASEAQRAGALVHHVGGPARRRGTARAPPAQRRLGWAV